MHGSLKKIKRRKLCGSIVSCFTCGANLCNCHLNYLYLYLILWKRTMQFSTLRDLGVTELYCLHHAELLYREICHIFETRTGNCMFCLAAVYSCNRRSRKVCNPSCFPLMGFWNLHFCCCTSSFGRWDFCSGFLPRDSVGFRNMP